MASQVEIMNRALVLLGEARITSPSDNVKAARELSAIWDTTRKALLRSYRWGFAMKRDELAALADAPLSQFDLQYQTPADFLRLDFVGDWFVGLSLSDYRGSDESEWALAAGTGATPVIETNMAAPLSIRYVGDIVNPNAFDALFTEAMAAKLALDAANALTQSAQKEATAGRAFERAIRAAVVANAIERPPVPIADDSWVMARL